MRKHSEKVAAILSDLRGGLEELYGERLERVILFGSQARGDAAEESDIDVLIVLDGEVKPGEEIQRTSELIAELSLRHDLPVSRVFTSTERFGRDRSPFLLNVRREGIPV